MAKLPLLAAGLLFIATSGYGQVVEGVVLEDSTRTPIVGATVQLITAKEGAIVATMVSDSLAEFTLHAGRTGTFLLRSAHPGYRGTETRKVNLRAGEVVVVELHMSRTAIPIEPLVVRARSSARLAGFYERARRGGFGYFITRQQIAERGVVHQTTDLLRSVPSIDIVPVKRGLSAPNVWLIRGRGGCQPALLIDGLPVIQSVDGGIDDFIKPEMVEGIEVYTSLASVPQEFVRPGLCGAVAIWTRPPEEKLGKFSLVKLVGGVSAMLVLIMLMK